VVSNPSTLVWYQIIRLSELLEPLQKDALTEIQVSEAREAIRMVLKQLYDAVQTLLGDRNAYYVLFAMTAYCDEIAHSYLQQQHSHGWEPLQIELFNINDAGTLFYRYVELFRGRNDIPSLIFEIYYYCLKSGFKGSYITNPAARKAYLDELEAHISYEKMPHTKPSDDSATNIKRRIPVWLYYFSLVLLILLLRLTLESIPLEIVL
jgi:type IV/VI secretion system ImpK/VasF family protein